MLFIAQIKILFTVSSPSSHELQNHYDNHHHCSSHIIKSSHVLIISSVLLAGFFIKYLVDKFALIRCCWIWFLCAMFSMCYSTISVMCGAIVALLSVCCIVWVALSCIGHVVVIWSNCYGPVWHGLKKLHLMRVYCASEHKESKTKLITNCIHVSCITNWVLNCRKLPKRCFFLQVGQPWWPACQWAQGICEFICGRFSFSAFTFFYILGFLFTYSYILFIHA